MFDAGACNTYGVTFLKSILTNRVRWYLPRDDNHRNGIHVGRYQASDGIGHTGT